MEPVLIHSVPRQAFNKHRPISDLVRKQVEHFKHVEEKLPLEVREKLPQHEIVTEDDAALYISAITKYLLSRPVAKTRPVPKVAEIDRSSEDRPSPPLALAAAAAVPAQIKSAAKKKSASKKETPAAKESRSTRPQDKKTSTKRKK
jgi:hypothetical protein